MELVDKAILGNNRRKKQRDRDTERERACVWGWVGGCVGVCAYMCMPTNPFQ